MGSYGEYIYEQGRKQGYMIGATLVGINCFKNNISIEDISKFTRISIENLKEIKKALDSGRLDDFIKADQKHRESAVYDSVKRRNFDDFVKAREKYGDIDEFEVLKEGLGSDLFYSLKKDFSDDDDFEDI